MSDELIAALIALGGVFIGALIQWLIAKHVLRAEAERLHRQLSTEFRHERFAEWQAEFRGVISELLALTEPETAQPFDKRKIVPLVLRAQLVLNPSVATHAATNDLINKLALAVCGWEGEVDIQYLFSLHAQLIDAAKKTLYLPGKIHVAG